LQQAAWKLYSEDQKDLVTLDNTNVSVQQKFDKTIQNLDEPTKAAFQKLAAMPDVLTLLTNNINLLNKIGRTL